MRKLLCALPLLLIAIVSFTQVSADKTSTSNQFFDNAHDTALVNRYINAAKRQVWTNPDSAINLFNKALLLSKQLQYTEGEFYTLALRAYPLAIVRADSAAVSSAFRAIELAEKEQKDEYLAGGYFTLGSVYIYIQDYRKGIRLHREALHYTKPTTTFFGTDLTSAIHEHFAECFVGLNQPDSALAYLEKVFDLSKQGSTLLRGYHSYLLGRIYSQKKDHNTALNYYRKALGLVSIENNGKDMAHCNIGIADVFQNTDQPDSAILYARKALAIASTSGLPNERLEALHLLISLFESKATIDSAFVYQKHSAALKDSVFSTDKLRQVQLIAFNEELKNQQETEQQRKRSTTLIIIALIAALVFVSVIAGLIFVHNKHRRKAFDLLQKQKSQTEGALTQLQATQLQLIQKEKMASLGELTAGIAHEIQNPLNFVNNFSEANAELLVELKQEASAGNLQEVLALADLIEANESKVHHHGRRAESIVKSMMEHSRTSKGEKQSIDLNALTDEYLKLAYHGFRAKDSNFSVVLETHYDPLVQGIHVVPQEIGQVLLNLFNNAFYAVQTKKQQLNGTFEPSVSVSTKKKGNTIVIAVKDNGTGMSPKVAEKAFQPFFTTKPPGEGTGLGLSLSYDIITKSYGGELRVESKEGEGAEFIVLLPRQNRSKIRVS